MKKTYFTPTLQMIHVETQKMIAASLPVSDDETNSQLAPGLPDDEEFILF